MRRSTMLLAVLLSVVLLGEGVAGAATRTKRSSRARSHAVRSAPARRSGPDHRYGRGRGPVHYVYRGGAWVAVPVAYPVYTETYVVGSPPPYEAAYEEEAPAPRRQVRATSYDKRRVGLLLSLGGLGLSPSSAQSQTDDLSLGSIGGAVRLNLDPVWALELALGYAQGSDRQWGLNRTLTPLSASLVLNLLPRSVINVYGLVGLGLQFADVRAPDYGYEESYRRPTAHLGGGVELRISPELRLFSELRFIGLGQVMNESSSSDPRQLPAGLSTQEGDAAVQFTAGLGVYF